MERQNSFAEYPDSDQSISEEEPCVSLRELVVQKLEENDPPGCGDKRQDGSPTWCTINQEAEALIHENKVLSSSSSHSTFSKLDRPCKGIRRKTKPKFSFHFQSKKRELSKSGTTKDEHLALYNLHKQPETEWETGFHFPMECLEDIEEENMEKLDITPVEVEDFRREHREMSIAELLDGIQDNTSLQTDGIVSGKKRQIATQMDVLLSCDRQDDNEDLTKSMNSDSPSDSEDGDQTLKLFIPTTSRQTITDKFEEFLGATLLDTENAFVTPPEPSRIGLFGKLQQVMRTEKLRDVDFLDKLHSETSANDATEHLDVKIVDKDFEAKLIVCGCFFYENLENSLPPPYTPNMENGMKKKKVIFNPRVCNSVDLAVGMFIRIHAPWKEISVGNGDSIILSTYFSQTCSL